MTPLALVALAWAVSALAMVAAWWVAMRVRNLGYVDVAWAGSMAVAALLAGTFGGGAALPRALVAVLGGAWGLRLCLYLFSRVRAEPEDGRYQALRAAWDGSPAKFFAFFQLQAVVAAVFTLPFVAAAARPVESVDGWMIGAIVTWLLAVGGEWLADRQLAAFRADSANRGRTCRVGLWGWSRHPNYFFEWLHWFAYLWLAIGGPLAWLALTGPVLMLLFLYRVSGIPWTEAQSLRSRGEDYARYQREVSAFFPWPPLRG
jgi:steroid 5-alpha reductase family enzyme